MTEASSALVEQPNSQLPAMDKWIQIMGMGDVLVRSGFLPDAVKTKEQAAAIILKGNELGIPAMQSFSHIHVIKGKPTCSSELMLALLARGGVAWEWVKSDQNEAEIKFIREGYGPVSGYFSMEAAKNANLNSPVWKSYPGNMLRARAISNGARMIAPDLLAGMSYTPEELGAVVDEDGAIVDFIVDAAISEVEVKEEANAQKEVKEPAWVRFRKKCGEFKEILGEDAYYWTLKKFDLGKGDIAQLDKDDTETMRAIVNALNATASEPEIALLDADGEMEIAADEPEVKEERQTELF